MVKVKMICRPRPFTKVKVVTLYNNKKVFRAIISLKIVKYGSPPSRSLTFLKESKAINRLRLSGGKKKRKHLVIHDICAI